MLSTDLIKITLLMIAVEMGVIQTIEKIGSKGGKNHNI